MKRLLAPHAGRNVKDIMLLFSRVLISYLLLANHGFPKLQRLFSGEPIEFFTFFGLSPEFVITLPIFAEFICALFIILGLFTRFAAIPLMINMAVIVFYVHGADPISSKELPVLFLIFFIFIFFTGAGRFSLDNLLHQRIQRKKKKVAFTV